MGVKGLWKLIESTGVPVPLETLEHKILAVDVSIWLHQAVRGFRGPGGSAVANAHLLTLFHRICKLLFYRIRPVFVFDGGVPHLKKQTLASRRLRREIASSKAKQVRERLLSNLLKSQAVRKALGRVGPGPSLVRVQKEQKIQKDMFELPPLPPSNKDSDGTTTLLGSDSEDEKESILRNLTLPNLHQFEYESDHFQSLPLESKHEILTELQNSRKDNSWGTINEMPQDSLNFSDFQMGRLMKRRKFQATLDSTREEIRKRKAAEMEADMFGDLEKHVSLTQQVISEDNTHSIFVKKVKENQENGKTEEEKNDDVKKEEKGKSPLKKREVFEKDFLTELAKQGLVRTEENSDSESDSDCDHSFYQLDEPEGPNITQDFDIKESKGYLEKDGLMKVVGSLLENNGLTQDEILALIKQDNNCEVKKDNVSISDKPTTSSLASGIVYNPDAESSSSEDDDSDFVEVPEMETVPELPVEKEKEEEDNVHKILETKSDSLWMKIVKQKLDDMVHKSDNKISPKKAIVDTRKLITSEKSPEKKIQSRKEDIKISLDFHSKPYKMEEDIFADIFNDDNKTETVVKQSNRQYEIPELGTEKAVLKKTHSNVGRIDSPNKVDNLSKPNISGKARTGSHSKTNDILKRVSVSESDVQVVPRKAMSKTVSCVSPAFHSELHKNVGINNKTLDLQDKQGSAFQKDLNVSEKLKLKVNELVRLEVEKMVKNMQPEKFVNTPTETLANLNEEQDIDDVEIMSSSSSSDDSEDDGNIEKTTRSEGSEVKENPACTITVRHKITTDTIDSDADFDDDIDFDETVSEKAADNVTTDKSSNPEEKDRFVSAMHQIVEPEGPVTLEKEYESKKEQESVSKDKNEGSSQMVERDKREDITKQPTVNTKEINEAKEPVSPDTAENSEVLERPLEKTEDELKQLEKELASEQQVLVAQAQKVERVASNLNDQMYGDAQELLQLFGIPYLVAPMEAEAQCGFLDTIKLTAGSITDDSDIFLFGGRNVYRNFFNQTKHVEFFKVDNIKVNIGLDRQKMITLALLTGSDYTDGIESVGAVSAMEVIAEFPGDGIECLRNLKKWWNVAHKNVSSVYSSKAKQKMSQVSLPESFPNENVYQAYLEPEVDQSSEKFSWAVPNVDALRFFAMEKFGWNRAKVDEILIPVMKKLGVKSSQMRIDSYFTNIKLIKDTKIVSKRMQDAIARAKGEEPQTSPLKKKVINQIARTKSRKRNNVESDPEEGAADSSETNVLVAAGSNRSVGSTTKPSRTLLMDPSESSSGPKISLKPTKRKREKSEARSSSPPPPEDVNSNVKLPRKVTKEDMYKAMLQRKTVPQVESDKKLMEDKKKLAAQVLKNKLGKGKK